MSNTHETMASRRMPQMIISFDKRKHTSSVLQQAPSFPVTTLPEYTMGSMIFFDLMKYADSDTNDYLYRYVGDDKVYAIEDRDLDITLYFDGAQPQQFLFRFLSYSNSTVLEIY